MLPQEEGEMGGGGEGGDAGHWEPAAKYDEDPGDTADTGHWTLDTRHWTLDTGHCGHWTRKHAAVAKYNWCHLQRVPSIGGVIAGAAVTWGPLPLELQTKIIRRYARRFHNHREGP